MAHLLDCRLARRCAALAAAVALVPAAGAHASTPAAPASQCAHPRVTNFLAADATHPGVITLYFFHAEGAAVTYFECIGGKAHRLGTRTTAAGVPTIMRDATTWSCDRLTRRFVATAVAADGTAVTGTYSVRTMSCAHRFEIKAPRRVAADTRLALRVVDRWGIGGIRTELCVTPPRDRRHCSTLAFPRAVGVASRRFRARVRGRLRVELRVRGQRVRTAAVAVGVASAREAKPPPLVLATGDSMMQGIDGFLADDLGDAATVRSDVRPGTAISRGDVWPGWSADQAARLRPAVTAIAIGPNEGWPMRTAGGATAQCCGEPWVAEFSRRVGAMMRTYLRGGRGRVIWLTLPAPRNGPLVAIIDAVNQAILRAGTGVPGVTILRTELIFTPDGYRDVMRWRGHDVRVREPDGMHLDVSGTAIAAEAIVRAIESR
jgi:hypothetical protein